MQLKISTECTLGKKMQTAREKSGGLEDEIVTCTIKVRAVRVDRDSMDELAGLPIGCTAMLFNELGAPFQHMSFLLPKRVLLGTGTIEHQRESGAVSAALKLKDALVDSLRFNLDMPEEGGPTAMLSFDVHWRAAGDEVEDVSDLLSRACRMVLTFKEEPHTEPLFPDKSAKRAGATTVRMTGQGFDSGEVKLSDVTKAVRRGLRGGAGKPKRTRKAGH